MIEWLKVNMQNRFETVLLNQHFENYLLLSCSTDLQIINALSQMSDLNERIFRI